MKINFSNKQIIVLILILAGAFMLAGPAVGATISKGLVIAICVLLGWLILKFFSVATIWGLVISAVAAWFFTTTGEYERIVAFGANLGGFTQRMLWIGFIIAGGFYLYTFFNQRPGGEKRSDRIHRMRNQKG